MFSSELILSLFVILSAGFFVGGVFLFCFESFREKEVRAGFIFMALGFFLIGLHTLAFYFEITILSLIIAGFSWGILLLLVIPTGKIKPGSESRRNIQVDERDIMFSRRLLEEGTSRYKEYYSLNPEKKVSDDKTRSKPGLLSKDSLHYHPLLYAAADASFRSVEALAHEIDRPVDTSKIKILPENLSAFLKGWSKKLGVVELGITLLNKEHLYSYRGRNHNYGDKVENTHKFAIAFTVEMDKELLDTAPLGPTVMESAIKYMNAGSIAIQIAWFIRNLGYDARPHIDGNYEVICPLVARDAGLGEIGRMGLLMTPSLGPRVRIGVVTTDLALEVDVRREDPAVLDFCEKCKKCAKICPSKAISFEPSVKIGGVKRWQINQEKCYDLWCVLGTDCGKCISVCPYSHYDNNLHKLVRWGIRRSSIFRRLAVPMDDLFYGKNPKPRDLKDWMKC
ncbi:MAG: 4Fe-4S dicluster domain-containing protein [Bacteroidota bacterium]|nr:4Fe-4S dicluster domain-containing protein [Bacteroidota bacterium]